MNLESNKIYKLRHKGTGIGPFIEGDSDYDNEIQNNYVYTCLVKEDGIKYERISVTILNTKSLISISYKAIDFVNNWEVVSEYKFEKPHEHISTTTH